MAAKSKNKYDVYSWIKDEVIPSCTTLKHYFVCSKLIRNLFETYNDRTLYLVLDSENTNHSKIIQP